eukprot:TRINITY_DN1022_c1_g2_i1.p1 TRINITY_DN1022_c1_g2~~TRINITY_DN1022_c1_g2_i1.p1  ORF type:complete len:195 (-),score=32.41 TRINITY_DN1022_c1_g2_i1:228-812(-)
MDGWVFAENFAPVPPIHSPRPGHSHQFPLGTFAQVVRLPPQPAPPRRPQPTAKQEGAEDKEGTNEDQNNGDDTSKLTVIVPRQAYAPGIRPLVATPTGPMPGLMSPRGMPHYALPYEHPDEPSVYDDFFHIRKHAGRIHHRGKKRDGPSRQYNNYDFMPYSGRVRAANRDMGHHFRRGREVDVMYPMPRKVFRY